MIKQFISKVVKGENLTEAEMEKAMTEIMIGTATPAQIGGFLIGLRMKGETVTEIAAAATVMRELASGVDIGGLDHAVDIVGTGGDASGTFNVSTASMFVAAAAGCHVAKHGNRSVSSKSGSADALESAGLRLDLSPEQVGRCVREVGVGFMFAPGHHSAMKHAIGPRREMGVRTVFNVLGPLTNPAGVPNQLLGVFSDELLEPLAEVLRKLGSRHVMVVHSRDGLDEISAAAPTRVVEARGSDIREYDFTPEDAGLQRVSLDGLEVRGAEESLELIRAALSGETGDRAERARAVVALNAGAALYVAGLQPGVKEGVAEAMALMQSGAPWAKVEALAELTSKM